MDKCLICLKLFRNNRSIYCHVKKSHGITSLEYRTKFGLLLLCKKCNKPICKKGSMSGFCNSCRDRKGNKNSFYGKNHSGETIDAIKEKTRAKTKELWLNKEYRDKVISGTTGVERDDSFCNGQKANAHRQFKDPNQRLFRSEVMKQTWKNGKMPICTPGSTSKIEMDFFSELEKISPYPIVKKTICVGDRTFLPDAIMTHGIVFEFYGDYWHGNPKKYNDTDLVAHKKPAKEIWERDRFRIEALEKYGYRVSIIWESDYRKDKDRVIQEIDATLNWDEDYLC